MMNQSLGWGSGAEQGPCPQARMLGAGRAPLIFLTGENCSGHHPPDEQEMTLPSLPLPELPGGCNTSLKARQRAVTPGNENMYTVCTPAPLSQSLYVLQSAATSQNNPTWALLLSGSCPGFILRASPAGSGCKSSLHSAASLFLPPRPQSTS